MYFREASKSSKPKLSTVGRSARNSPSISHDFPVSTGNILPTAREPYFSSRYSPLPSGLAEAAGNSAASSAYPEAHQTDSAQTMNRSTFFISSYLRSTRFPTYAAASFDMPIRPQYGGTASCYNVSDGLSYFIAYFRANSTSTIRSAVCPSHNSGRCGTRGESITSR